MHQHGQAVVEYELSVLDVGIGMSTLAAAGALALAAGLGCANEDAAPKKNNATTRTEWQHDA